jgi:hypothetical protein
LKAAENTKLGEGHIIHLHKSTYSISIKNVGREEEQLHPGHGFGKTFPPPDGECNQFVTFDKIIVFVKESVRIECLRIGEDLQKNMIVFN